MNVNIFGRGTRITNVGGQISVGIIGAVQCTAYRRASWLVLSMVKKSGDYNSRSFKPEVMYAYS
jgi:hypothetical protein